MHILEQIEAIKRLKYRYFRCLDCKDWETLAECFTADATVAYDSGKFSFSGRSEVMGFLRGALGSREVISLHQGHHPEVEISGEIATGIWYLEDYLIFVPTNTRIRGAGFYRDEYLCEGGVWKIKHTGYVRSFEEIQDGNATPPLWVLTNYGDHLRRA
ncbi:MAG TPA: nuclear transport factor 2 family protein [Terriglobales bacterium]|nr:nuclear transport factor 2 family protein [Terriglobales bacterium]